MLSELLEAPTPRWLCALGLDVGRRPGGELKPRKISSVLFFQKVVQEELDALLEQQSTIENKMVAVHRMGLVIPTVSPSFCFCTLRSTSLLAAWHESSCRCCEGSTLILRKRQTSDQFVVAGSSWILIPVLLSGTNRGNCCARRQTDPFWHRLSSSLKASPQRLSGFGISAWIRCLVPGCLQVWTNITASSWRACASSLESRPKWPCV